jgi:DNA-binding IclR family transcriptional regulator
MTATLYKDNDMDAVAKRDLPERKSILAREDAATVLATGRRVRQVPAVTRAVAILRLLGQSEEPLGLNAIARALELVPSTCLHILRALAAEELVAFEPVTKRYRLDAGLLTLARSALRRVGFAELAQPELDRLSRRHAVTAIGVQVIGLEHIVVVGISRSDDVVRLHVDIGSRFPALLSAPGHCIAAFGGHALGSLERRVRALRWDRPPELAEWRAEVEAARVKGYAVDEGGYLKGVTVIAAPVRDAGDAVNHVVVVVGVIERVREIGVEAMGREVAAVADGLSRKLGVG